MSGKNACARPWRRRPLARWRWRESTRPRNGCCWILPRPASCPGASGTSGGAGLGRPTGSGTGPGGVLGGGGGGAGGAGGRGVLRCSRGGGRYSGEQRRLRGRRQRSHRPWRQRAGWYACDKFCFALSRACSAPTYRRPCPPSTVPRRPCDRGWHRRLGSTWPGSRRRAGRKEAAQRSW